MTLLDDYETFYRLRGVQVVSDMNERVPADLLRRTGVDGLLFSVRRSQRSAVMSALTPSIFSVVTEEVPSISSEPRDTCAHPRRCTRFRLPGPPHHFSR